MPDNICLPADGVYAGTFAGADGVRTARRDLGRDGARPSTPKPGMFLLEAYVLDFDGDLYGQQAPGAASPTASAGQERFEDVDDLIAQMRRDVDGSAAPARRVTRARSGGSGSVAG